MKKLILIIGVAIALAAAVMVVRTRPAVAPTPEALPDKEIRESQSNTATGMPKLIIGQPDAKLTIIDYGDFQCPICKRFFETTEQQLIKDYVDTGRVNIEFRVEAHLGEDSLGAGEGAYCAAEQNNFKAYHDQLFFHQGQTKFTRANLKAFAGGGVVNDHKKFEACLDNSKYRAVVEASHREAQSRISGTPTFFIGDQKIVGAQPYNIFKTVLDAQLR